MISSSAVFIANSTVIVSPTGAKLIKQAEILVFNSKDILESYFALEHSKPKKIVLLRNLFLPDIIKIFFIIVTSKKIITTHECCWYQLDMVLMILRVRHQHFETLTLNGLLKRPFKIIRDKKFSFIDFFVLRIKKIIINYFFETYWEFIDENNQSFPMIKMKSKYLSHRRVLQRDIFLNKRDRKNTNKVLLLLCKEPIDAQKQIDHYSEIISNLTDSGFSIFLKDHVRLQSRFLNNESLAVLNKLNLIILPPQTPSEIFINQLDILLIISISSTGICHNSTTGISTIMMLEFSEKYKKSKTQTINYLAKERNTTVYFPNTASQFEDILIKTAEKSF